MNNECMNGLRVIAMIRTPAKRKCKGQHHCLDQYQNMERDSIIESKGIWFDRCELNSSIIDPDLELLENELQIENVPSVNTFFLILTILCAVMRRNNFVN